MTIVEALYRNHLDVLAEGLRSEQAATVRMLVWVLGRFGAPASRYLKRATSHPDAQVRREVARSLAAIGDEEAGRQLGAMLHDGDTSVAAVALVGLEAGGPEQVLASIEAELGSLGLEGRDTTFKLALIRAAGRLGAASTLPLLRPFTERSGLSRLRRSGPLSEAARAAIVSIEEREARRATT